MCIRDSGTHVAWVSAKDGSPEIYVASLTDGTSTRLTYWGTHWARVSGWTPAGEVLAVSRANQPFAHYTPARALTTALSGSPGAERVLPFGPASDLSLGTGGDATRGDSAAADSHGAGTIGLLTGKFGGLDDDPATWKRYRGGTAGRLWVGPATAIVSAAPDAAGRTAGPFRRVLEMCIRDRANNVEIAYTPTNSSWLNRIEAQFTALRYFALDGTDHASHKEQASMIRRYIIWRNNHAYDERLRRIVDRANVA